MSVRKRVWATETGQHREAWVVDYVDQQGGRRLKTFKRKGDADSFAATTTVQISEGVHVPESTSLTIKDAAENWITRCKSRLQDGTLDQYRQHVDLHIVPFIGRVKLSKVTVPFVCIFEDTLREEGRSPAMVRAVRVSLGALLSDAQKRGHIVRNPVRESRGNSDARRKKKRKLKVGVDIPTPYEVRSLLATATGSFRILLLTAVFTGLRASELRGLQWIDVDLTRKELHVVRRADKHNQMGVPKSEASERTLPLTPGLVQALREWKLQCPKKEGRLWLVFPNGKGNVEAHRNILERQLKPAMKKASIVTPELDEQGNPKLDKDGKPIMAAKYSGLHCLRHFFASWCINRKVDGGLELPAKVVQERLGHASIAMTLDVYGHLFPSGDDHAAELAAGEKLLLG
ncbi:MAG: site-specific integrase [Nitrobacter sp. 62-13]|uniref:tyrosine-type recombinase/integrase n=1 Tax=Nitrobacter sp. 62-13 TaxID=1895797 RepID=UPI000963ABA0|nr:site-specific integrase [Nitrobacter sp. 62-13]OJU24188.1 MAG: site-specific integrase [Nitrobacter sp. 62-13]